MSSEVTFEEIVEVKIDNRGKTPPIVPAGHPLVEVNALVDCGLHPDISKVSKFVDEETWGTWFRQHLQKDDVVFSTVGTIGETAIVSNEPNYGIAQNILGFRFRKNIVSPLYLLFLMRSSWFVHQVTGRTIETVQKSIKWSDMRGIKLSLPSVPTQEKIAKILGDFDQKIELNRRTNKSLEQVGQALFRHYFIDNPEREGWIMGIASDLFDLTMGLSPKGESYNDEGVGVPLLNGAADFKNGLLSPSRHTSQPARISKVGDIIFCIRGTIGNVTIGRKEYCLGRGVSALTPKKDSQGYVYFHTQKEIDRFNSSASGSVIKGLTKDDIANVKINLPPAELLEEFESITTKILGRIHTIHTETTLLTGVRDSLLPKLISGQISV